MNDNAIVVIALIMIAVCLVACYFGVRELIQIAENRRWRRSHNEWVKDVTEGMAKMKNYAANDVNETLSLFKDVDIDRNEHSFLFEDTSKIWFCQGKHNYTLVDVIANEKDPGLDVFKFSCTNENDEGVKCSSVGMAERAFFWMGIKRSILEMYVDREWERNYDAHIYNQNKRAFEREWALGGVMILPEPAKIGPKCGHSGPEAYPYRCVKLAGHEHIPPSYDSEKEPLHGYAGVFWDNQGNLL